MAQVVYIRLELSITHDTWAIDIIVVWTEVNGLMLSNNQNLAEFVLMLSST